MTPEETQLVDRVLSRVTSRDLRAAQYQVNLCAVRAKTKHDELMRAEAELEEAERALVQECKDHLESV